MDTTSPMEINIKQEFRDLIPPLSKEELEGLEKNILANGCEQPIKLWQGYIVDGHNRYHLCSKHSLPFKTEELEVEDEDDVMIWMIDNQKKSRRNIETPAKIRLGLKKESILADKAEKRMKAGKNIDPEENLPQGSRDPQVRDIIGKSAGVSGKTVDKFKYIQKSPRAC